MGEGAQGTVANAFAGDEWRGRTGDSWAAEWQRTDRSFAGLTGHLLGAIDAAMPSGAGGSPRVLDIGCGAGETSIGLARRRPDLVVTGLDLSNELVTVAKGRAAGLANLDFVAGDASSWHDETGFDGAMSRHGVMFFADPQAAFVHLHGLLRPGAPLAFTCFAEPAANPWASELAALVGAPKSGDPRAPGPFAFADPDYVAALLSSAGWRDATPERVEYGYVAGAGVDPVADALSFFARIGPAAAVIAALPTAEAAMLKPRMATWLERHVEGGEVRFPATAWLWRATA